MIETVKELREYLDMKPDGLLSSPNGTLADILSVNDGMVTIGIIGTGQVIEQPICNFCRENPNNG